MTSIKILEEMKQQDYELWIRTQGYSHLTEEQWDWLIANYLELNNKMNNHNNQIG